MGPTAHPAARVIHRRSATAEELNRLRDNLSRRALAAAVLRVVLPRRDPPLHVNLPALFQILAADISELAPRDDPIPFGPLLPRATAILEDLARRDPQIPPPLPQRYMPSLRPPPHT